MALVSFRVSARGVLVAEFTGSTQVVEGRTLSLYARAVKAKELQFAPIHHDCDLNRTAEDRLWVSIMQSPSTYIADHSTRTNINANVDS